MIVRWLMSSRLGKHFHIKENDPKSPIYAVTRVAGPRSYHKQEGTPIAKDWWKYFYYEVEPIEKVQETEGVPGQTPTPE